MSEADQLTDIKKRFASVSARHFPQGLHAGSGGPTDSDMEKRVTQLESGITEIKSVLGRLEPKISDLHTDVAEMKGRLSGMPTTWHLVGLVFAIFAAAFALIKLAN
jgi:hypothetical protein